MTITPARLSKEYSAGDFPDGQPSNYQPRLTGLSLRSWRYCKRPRNKVLDKRAAKPRGEWGEGL